MTLLESVSASLKEAIEIMPLPHFPNDPFTSQGGNRSFIPLNGKYPLDKMGKPMAFLAQINKEELPSPWKDNEIIQFYVSHDNLNDPSLKEDFRIVTFAKEDPLEYHHVSNVLAHQFTFLEAPYKLHFSKKQIPFPSCDHGFRDIYDEVFKTTHDMDAFDGFFFDHYGRKTDHRIGGYPSFIKEHYEGHLLLQLALGHDLYQGGDIWISFFSQEKSSYACVECHIFTHI